MRIVTIVWILMCFIAGFLFFRYLSSGNQISVFVLSPLSYVTPTSLPLKAVSKTLFIPYWTLGKDTIDSENMYMNLVYFGISADKNGIDSNDAGYTNLDRFLSLAPKSAKKLLGVRMINADSNSVVLVDETLQKKIITDAIAIAKEKHFEGIVLDFEISALGFETVVQNITNFERQFAKLTKSNNLAFYATVYGDTFMRFRPFDVEQIAKYSDGIMIMAYDFHKSRGENPGANFPLHDNGKEGYDFTLMIDDFLKYVPAQKITVIFGLFGYDWPIDDKKNATAAATALSYNKIKQEFLASCGFINCYIRRDNISSETEITYTDTANQKHAVWFEDISSIDKKISFLSSKNVGKVAYWGYSYF